MPCGAGCTEICRCSTLPNPRRGDGTRPVKLTHCEAERNDLNHSTKLHLQLFFSRKRVPAAVSPSTGKETAAFGEELTSAAEPFGFEAKSEGALGDAFGAWGESGAWQEPAAAWEARKDLKKSLGGFKHRLIAFLVPFSKVRFHWAG